MRAWLLAGSMVAVMPSAVGCQGEAVPLEPNPAFVCQLTPDPGFGPYGICPEAADRFEVDLSVACTDWMQRSLDDSLWCGACFCNVGCSVDDDCPLPTTGTVTPECQSGGRCALPCDNGERCPAGMQCTQFPGEEGMDCAWLFSRDDADPTSTEENLRCATEFDWDVCGKRSTPAECEADIDADPVQPRIACSWATVSTFATGNEACDPLRVEEKCVEARLADPADIRDASQCGDTFVHWTDLGAGTATLTELSRCGYEPIETTPCEFGDPTVPLLCDCACDGGTRREDAPVNSIPGAIPTDQLCQPRLEPSVGKYGYCDGFDEVLTGYGGSDGCPEGSAWFLYFESNGCSRCECLLSCVTDADCPAAESGNVEPICQWDSCRLPCNADVTCPAGMTCVEVSDTGKFCVWEYPATSDACRFLENDATCAERTSKESCEADFRAAPRDPPLACLWATESIYSTNTESCEAVITQERCVATMLNPESAEEPLAHRCGDTSVFWRDLGAGTSMLLEIEACGYTPVAQDLLDYEPCELGDPSTPQLCSCGCL